MANLTGKFDALKTFLTALFEPVTTPLDAINTKLDALAAIQLQLEGPVPYETTVRDVLQSLSNNLNATRTATQALNTSVAAINTTTAAISTRDALRYTLEQQVATAIGASSGAGLAPLTETQRNIADLLAILNANLGGTTGTTPGTVIALLRTLPDILACVCGGNEPNPDDPLGCDSPFTSISTNDGLPEGDGIPARNYAVFPVGLPSGLTFGGTDPLATSNAELENTNWSGWRYYVQSNAPSHKLNSTSGVSYPNNVWRSFASGAANYTFSVDSPDVLIVYICPPATALPTICSDFTANLDIRGQWGYRIAGYPGNWSVQATDNWYAESDLGITLGGPYSANQVYSISSLPALPFRMRFGFSVSVAAPTGQICPPA